MPICNISMVRTHKTLQYFLELKLISLRAPWYADLKTSLTKYIYAVVAAVLLGFFALAELGKHSHSYVDSLYLLYHSDARSR